VIHARPALIAAALLAATPASAEGNWFTRLFSREPAPAPRAAPAAPAKPAPATAQAPAAISAPRTAPAPAASAASTPQAPAPSAASASQAVSTRAVPAKRPAEPVPQAPATQAAAPAAQATATAPAAPARPIAPAPTGPAQPVAPPTTTAAIAPPAPPPAPLSERAIVERANAYFNGLHTLVGDFVQVGGDGRKLGGKLYLQRPGKLRFEYAAPATLEVVADGSSVAVRDRKLATQDLYSIGQTPLKFLLRDRIDLTKDNRLVDVGSDADGVRVVLEDRSTLGGTSKISLFFDDKVETLTRWRIVDPQGFLTTVTLSNLDRSRRVDAKLFTIAYERVLNDSAGP
jgi:outer membrane lipoprotein-sorting protein